MTQDRKPSRASEGLENDGGLSRLSNEEYMAEEHPPERPSLEQKRRALTVALEGINNALTTLEKGGDYENGKMVGGWCVTRSYLQAAQGEVEKLMLELAKKGP
ncbi:hypothetical protein RQ831_03835 [Roseomonas gilardii]|uniref:Uncharacterized protein n=1 Tax=Roseomonas gilardii TaxID=257708 RepID=A0ABU3MB99_9PROT|nr:hypothetical protein [Roseomonas gilardii]MDT8330171.1 hypothetical protein [Roseomonas gilardii]